jgi:hypothetical protein
MQGSKMQGKKIRKMRLKEVCFLINEMRGYTPLKMFFGEMLF